MRVNLKKYICRDLIFLGDGGKRGWSQKIDNIRNTQTYKVKYVLLIQKLWKKSTTNNFVGRKSVENYKSFINSENMEDTENNEIVANLGNVQKKKKI